MVEPLTLIQNISYFWDLTFNLEVLWNIIPLAIATIVILMYFERYEQEKEGWNSYLSNSLVLLFVSVALFRYIYSINGIGAFNFVDYIGKTIATASLLLVGLILFRFNFEHLLPKRFAKYFGSILAANIGAYAVILFVYSKFPASWNDLFALLIIATTILIVLSLTKYPLNKIFKYLEKEKRKEQIKDVKESKYQIGELKKDLKSREKQLKKTRLKELDQEKNQVIKLKKIIKK